MKMEELELGKRYLIKTETSELCDIYILAKTKKNNYVKIWNVETGDTQWLSEKDIEKYTLIDEVESLEVTIDAR